MYAYTHSGDNMKKICTYVDEKLAEDLKKYCERKHKKYSDMLRDLIVEELYGE